MELIEIQQIQEYLNEEKKQFNKKRNNITKRIEKIITDLQNYEYCENGNEFYLKEQIKIMKVNVSAELILILQSLSCL